MVLLTKKEIRLVAGGSELQLNATKGVAESMAVCAATANLYASAMKHLSGNDAIAGLTLGGAYIVCEIHEMYQYPSISQMLLGFITSGGVIWILSRRFNRAGRIGH